jgi:uncharacterized protein (TIGR02996 family)
MSELDEALAAFASQRSAVLAGAIEVLGRTAIDGFVPVPIPKNLEYHRAWKQLAREPARRTWCLETILDKLPGLIDGKEHPSGDKCEALVERIDALTACAPDPRIARAMLAVCELNSPVCGFTIVYEAMARAVVAHADDGVASLPALAELTEVSEANEIVGDHLPPPVKLAADVAARWGKVKPAPPPRNLDALYADVYAAPDADEPRAILADALQEAGDPRGEFIALQLREAHGDASEELRARAQELVQLHGKTWLGPLRPIAVRAVMRRGFLQRLDLAGSWATKKWKEMAAEPMLATVEELVPEQATGAVYAKMLDGVLLGALQTVSVFDDAIWKLVTSRPMPRLSGIMVRGWTRKNLDTQWKTLIAPWLEQHPRINRLGCDGKHVAMLSKAARGRLAELVTTESIGRAAKLWAELPRLERLTCGWTDPVMLVRVKRKPSYARVIADRLGTTLPELGKLPKEIQRVEVVGNQQLAKELRARHKKLAIVDVKPPSGLITGIKK